MDLIPSLQGGVSDDQGGPAVTVDGRALDLAGLASAAAAVASRVAGMPAVAVAFFLAFVGLAMTVYLLTIRG